VNDWAEEYCNINPVLVPTSTVTAIVDEAKATRGSLRLTDAILVLVFERWERGIITKTQRDYLVNRLYS
jgi:hypothetical protein